MSAPRLAGAGVVTRVAVLRANGEALVKEGGLSAGWITEHTEVTQVALSGNRIAVLRANGEALVKEGGLSAGWITVHTRSHRWRCPAIASPS